MAVCAALLSAGLTGCRGREEAFVPLEETPVEEEIAYGETEEAAERESGTPPLVSPTEPEPSLLYVDVCGAVEHPGVYSLEEGSRVYQAIEAAGGYLPQAAQTYINRAKCLEDGQQIYVPTMEELAREELPPRQEAGGQEDAPGSGEAPDGKARVNLNTAGEAELTALTGIGEAKARAIIAYRQAQGPFRAVEEIMNVEGIKEGTFSKIKDQITVE